MKKIVKVSLILLVILMSTMAIHAIAMPQLSRCLVIDAYEFKQVGNLYYRPDVSEEKITALNTMLEQAKERNLEFWGNNTASPKFIYCDTDDDYRRFGSPMMTPAGTHPHFQSYVIISREGLNLDILAHEICHAELSARVGFVTRALKLPVWFDEGVAMQIDHRNYYSLDSLAVKSNQFTELPDIENMGPAQFWGGNHSDIRMNYLTAKYKIQQWDPEQNLSLFIKKINEGASFEEAYSFNK
ncbi:hypothetical protein [Flammeovirga agarivorans]|uniref:Peptidase MA superfamily protein n=1 Tax=Flammeovirga agarivorans TaxID=2726742 RepID=A0A7X8SPB7_9BACT|nr:hypothetical protein [Flammeovirga agarivorans]NLR93802.1 hypothetical protein [Flammeovirga agarivorans]